MLTIDENLFFLINHLELGFLEPLFVLFRNKFFWIPLYVFVVYWMFRYFPIREAVALFLLSFVCLGVSDQVSSEFIKKQVERPRPCQVASGLEDVDLKVDCGPGYSFTSSHAANHMAIAVFWIMTVFAYSSGWKYLLILWAMVIGFCQIYVGVHYPSDVLSGFVLGATIGLLLSLIFRYFRNRFVLDRRIMPEQ